MFRLPMWFAAVPPVIVKIVAVVSAKAGEIDRPASVSLDHFVLKVFREHRAPAEYGA